MASIAKSALLVALFAIVYEFWISDLLFVTWGLNRVVKPIETFPYKCRRYQDKQLQGCGKLWLDEDGRMLYAVCGGRRVLAIYIDEQKKDGVFHIEELQTATVGGRSWDGSLDISSFTGEFHDDSTLRFWFVNHRLPVGPRGQSLDVRRVGKNVTVDAFEHTKRGKSMKHYMTVSRPEIYAPANIAYMGADCFVVNNDRSKSKLRRIFDGIRPGGNLVYYDGWDKKNGTSTPISVRSARALVRGRDDRMYVGSATDGKIRVYQLLQGDIYKQYHVMRLNMPIESLSLDNEGLIWAVARSRYDPKGRKSATAIYQIEKANVVRPRYFIRKMIEDAKGKMLAGASAVVHDVKNDRLFIGGTSKPTASISSDSNI